MFNSKQANAQYAETRCTTCEHTALRLAKRVKDGSAVCQHWTGLSDGACKGKLVIVRLEPKAERIARFNRMCEARPGSETYLCQ